MSLELNQDDIAIIEDSRELYTHGQVFSFSKVLDSSTEVSVDLEPIYNKLVELESLVTSNSSSLTMLTDRVNNLLNYVEGTSGTDGTFTIPESLKDLSSIHIVSMTYMHPNLGIYVPCMVADSLVYTAEHTFFNSKFSELTEFPNSNYRIYFNHIT